MDERDLLNRWHNLFKGKLITDESLNAAEAMLNGLNGESPLHIRLASELEELKKRLTDVSESASATGRQKQRTK